jgi:hypothetical protein
MIFQIESVEVPYESLEKQMERDIVTQERNKRVIAYLLSGHFQALNKGTDGYWDGIIAVVSSELQPTEISQ